jgi:hypothetical protein
MSTYFVTIVVNEIAPKNGKRRAIIHPRKGKRTLYPGRKLSQEGIDFVRIKLKDGTEITFPKDHPAVADDKNPGWFRYDVDLGPAV